MNIEVSALLLEKDVILQDVVIPVYGLANLNISPKGNGFGRVILMGMEELAKKNDKYAVVAFARDDVLDFYLKCGWYNCGKYQCKVGYGEKNIVSSVPLGQCTVEEDW